MIFHEIYGKYYSAVAKILRYAAEKGSISPRELQTIVSESAFQESGMYIPDAMTDSWFLLRSDGGTVLRQEPSWPLTLTEKRWLKAILQDPRIRLFDLPENYLEDVEPLYTPDMICWFDRYGDGDPYEDPAYIAVFRQLLQAIREKRAVRLAYKGGKGERVHPCVPYRLEYSEKDDKFRLLVVQRDRQMILNLAKILSCEILGPVKGRLVIPQPQKTKLVLELMDGRNALERAMLHFSHLEKETEQLEEGKYRITLFYETRDEPELLIRILSFGPLVRVLEPELLINRIKSRIQRQKNLRTL